ncbi:MAG: GIY-YIG nuclease family protein [Candidatus Omnitrophica bacterium]|nr:GIY-YIG nuclease family protein [Candidatus Omnitrophota bacterium]
MLKEWFVYIVKCSDNTLYTGITNDLSSRIKAHNTGKASKYTLPRTPVALIYKEPCGSRSLALKRESEIKSYKRHQKLELLATE